jgi:hypothetical protein
MEALIDLIWSEHMVYLFQIRYKSVPHKDMHVSYLNKNNHKRPPPAFKEYFPCSEERHR